MEKMWTMNDEGRKKEIGKLIRFYRIDHIIGQNAEPFYRKILL